MKNRLSENRRKAAVLLIAGAVLFGGASAQAQSFMDWNFDLLPFGGAVSGLPGSTVGWGYSITNFDSISWLMLTGISADPFVFGTPDSSVFDFPILAPGRTAMIPYDGTSGLYQLTWDLTAPAGFVNSGMFLLNAEWWIGDPFAGGSFLDFAPDRSAAYTATVAAASVPEPGTLLLVASGLTGLAVVRRRISARDR